MHGEDTAVHMLGYCYRYGHGVSRNLRKGFTLELEAAKKGVTEAQFSVGVCFSRGEGVSANFAKAFKWYLAAARKGHDEAAHNVACYYETGRGVRQNAKRATKWYASAKAIRSAAGSPTRKFKLSPAPKNGIVTPPVKTRVIQHRSSAILQGF